MLRPFDEMFTAGMIAKITGLSYTTVRVRIRDLDMLPVGMNGTVKYYHHSAIEFIREFKPNQKYLIFQSKMNRNDTNF
jgi:hypothetical protein